MSGDLRGEDATIARKLPRIDPATSALFLDIDGTLIDIAAVPEAIEVPDGLPLLLSKAIDTLSGAVAIVTGRRIADADRILAPVRIVAAGVHGCEMRTEPDGIIVIQALTDMSILDDLVQLAKRYPGVLIEPKGSGIAVHYRLAASSRNEIERDVRILIARYGQGLQMSAGRMVFEVLPFGWSKGRALETFMQLAPFAGRTPVMVGDDIGDLGAFAVAERLGGCALKVAGEHFPVAIADFSGPAAVRQWLQKNL